MPTWSVYPLWLSAACPWPRLPCVYSITCLPPASTLCLLSVYDSAVLRYPWRCYQICLTRCTSNKAAYGSQRHWLCVTEDFARYPSSSLLPFHNGNICSSDRTCYPATTAEPPYLSHGGAGKVFASSSSSSTQHERFSAESTSDRIHLSICDCQLLVWRFWRSLTNHLRDVRDFCFSAPCLSASSPRYIPRTTAALLSSVRF